ncbi:MAG: glycosyltransferase family 39 protein [Phycisphaerae bacterium]|jgi:hypothetical protein
MKKIVSDNPKPTDSKSILFNICLTMLFILLVSVTVIIRIRTLNVPLERDEGEYAYAGQLMLEGVPPYSLAYNMKMPGIYAAYAVILAVFGQTVSGIHLAVLFINMATVLFLFFMTKKLFGPIAGVGAAVFFAITSISNTIQATANAENFVVFFAMAGIILLMNFAETKKYLYLITGGLLLGIAFMMKQHGAGFILFGLFFLIWKQVRQKPITWKKPVLVIAIYGISVLVPFLITCLILWRCGVFEKFWFWTFNYARHYVSVVPFATGLGYLNETLGIIVPSAWFVWLSALLGLLRILRDKKIHEQSVFAAGFLILSFVSVCPSFYFRPHYFVLFLPVLSILAGAGVAEIKNLVGRNIKSAAKTSFISILIILVIWLQSFYSQRNYLLESDPIILSRYTFGRFPFSEAREIGNFIKNHSGKEDKIAVLGSEPEIYFYSQRRSATSYIYTYPLMEPQPYAVDMQREMISQIEANKPRFVVVVRCFDSWIDCPIMEPQPYVVDMQRKIITQIEANKPGFAVVMKGLDSWTDWPGSERLIFNWIDQYVSSRYRQIGLVEMFPRKKTLYYWDSAAKPSKKDGWLFVGERID